jgi:uncharacterized protein
MKTLIWIVGMIAVLAGVYWYIGEEPGGDSAQRVGVANPASVNCVETLGGVHEVVEEAEGQAGYCRLPDGRVCEEWALLREGACNAPKAAEAGVACRETEEYFIIAKSRVGTSEPGEDLLVKRKNTPTQAFSCAFSAAPDDIEIPSDGPTYALDITGDFLLLDHGTAPPPRGFTVFDLSKEKETYAGTYNQPFEVSDGTFAFWEPLDTKPTAANCPDLSQFEAMGLGAGLERRVRLDLSTLKITDLKETRCSARQ